MPSKPRKRLCYEELDAGDAKAFVSLYAIFADLFPFPDEREPPEAFYDIYALNERTEIQQRLGPWREIVAAIRSWRRGPLIGGHIFGVTTSDAHLSFGCLASIQAIYTFIERRSRGKLDIQDAKAYMIAEALTTFGFTADMGTIPPVIFSEVNNPRRMTPEQIEQDRAISGIDPFRRYQLWKNAGLKPLDFTYVQPALGPNVQPVHYLDLFCSTEGGATIPSALILAHLKAFVAISVLKGREASTDADFNAMAAALAQVSAVGFVPDDDSGQQEIAKRASESRKA